MDPIVFVERFSAFFTRLPAMTSSSVSHADSGMLTGPAWASVPCCLDRFAWSYSLYLIYSPILALGNLLMPRTRQ